MQVLSILLVIVGISVSPLTKHVSIHKEILYTRTGCINKLKSCIYMTPEQVSWSNVNQLKFVSQYANYTEPNTGIGIVFNGINIRIEEVVASILFLRIKKCVLPITVVYNDLPEKQIKVLRFLPNTNVIQATNISTGLFAVDFKQILFVNEAIYFLKDPSDVTFNIFFPSTQKYAMDDLIWSLYHTRCINQYIPNSKFISFDKSLLLKMELNELDLSSQLFMTTLNSELFKFEEFPDLLGSLKCQHSLLYSYNGRPLFIDFRDLRIDTVVKFTMKDCNTYPSAVFDGCYRISDYGVVSQRTKSDLPKGLKNDLETIRDAIDMSNRFVHLEPYENYSTHPPLNMTTIGFVKSKLPPKSNSRHTQLLELHESESRENQGMRGKNGFFAYLAELKRPWQIVNLQTREDVFNFLYIKVHGSNQPNMKKFLPKKPWARSSTKKKIGEIKSFYVKLIAILGKDDSYLPLKSPIKVLHRIYGEKQRKPTRVVQGQVAHAGNMLGSESTDEVSEEEPLTEESSEDPESSITEYEEMVQTKNINQKSPRSTTTKAKPVVRKGPFQILNGTPPQGQYPPPFVVQSSFSEKRPEYSISPRSLDTSQYITPPQSQNHSPEMIPLTIGDAQTSPLRQKLQDNDEILQEIDNSSLPAQPRLSAMDFISSIANDFESFPETFDFLEQFTELYFGLCGNPANQDKILRVVKMLIPVFKSSQDTNDIVGAMKMILETCEKVSPK